VTDTADVAERVVRGLEDRVAAVASRTAAIPREQRPRVYWEVFAAPLMTAGRGSMLGRLIELAGGENLFADLREEYPQIGTEAVVTRDPQVILGADMAATGAGALTVERLRERPGWAGLTAVRTGRVVALPADPVSRPGPRLVDALEQVEALLRADLRGVAPVEVKR
jgi:iron complex transport system substrate-binding protein